MAVVVATSLELTSGERDAILGVGRVRLVEVGGGAPDAALESAEVWFGPPLSPAELAQAPRLRWLQAASAGVDQYMARELSEAGVALTSAAGAHGEQAPAHVFALILALAHRLPTFFARQAGHEWRDETSMSLAGATLLVVGLGAIGRGVAALGSAFSMRVLGVRRSGTGLVPGAQRVLPAGQLDGTIGEADWVVLACPLTPETRHLVDARRLGAMRRSAFLVNISRGSVVDEAALVDALRARRIAGAGLDVFEEEPLPASSPLWAMPNVIVTPHVAGSHPSYVSRLMPIFLDNLQRFLTGAPMRNLVDPARGY
ncbi:MAG: D-2-hydroxyacid dehydrogenase [Candidatus Dormibacterales bacterium]